MPARRIPIGKCFYIQLDGNGRMPVLHFGMTGMLKVRFSPARSIDVPISMPLGQRPPNPTVQIQGRRLSRRLASTICKGRTLFSSPFVANFNQRIAVYLVHPRKRFGLHRTRILRCSSSRSHPRGLLSAQRTPHLGTRLRSNFVHAFPPRFS